MNQNKNLLNYAQEFAREAHKSDEWTSISGVKTPQINHVQQVADLVWASGGTDNEIIAAWLHDTVEDTKVTLDDIKNIFGDEVAEIVDGLTDRVHYNDMLLPERKKMQAERLLGMSTSVRRIKLADQLSNIRGLGVDPIDDMTNQECYQYIFGANLLARGCRGISPLLEELFDKHYKIGIERFKE